MNYKFSGIKNKSIVAFVIILFASSSFFIAPRTAQATLPTIDIGALPFNIGSFIQNTLGTLASVASKVYNAISAATQQSSWVKEYVLDPVAWLISQTMVQSVTGSVISFVNGKGNGTGASQFVTNLQGHLQNVGDKQTSSFLVQFAKNSNSPFAAAISSSLRTNYLQGTSLAGFWASNKCTLSKSSPDVNKFVAGNWSQGGGVKAWLALTTQQNNNPYMSYQSAKGMLGSTVSNAQTARSSDINRNSGFISWCGVASAVSDATDVAFDPCTNKDGSPGTIQTPGSVIQAQLTKSLGAGVEKIAAADEISETLGQIAISFVSGVLSGGLSKNSAATRKYTGDDPSAKIDVSSQVQQKTKDANMYKGNWEKIVVATKTASTSVASLADYCIAQGELAKKMLVASSSSAGLTAVLNTFVNNCAANVTSAQNTINGVIAPMLGQANTAFSTVEKTMNMILKIQNEASSTKSNNVETLASDLSALLQMPPTPDDIAESDQKSKSMVSGMSSSAASSMITASPAGSLNVGTETDPSVIDQMGLISTNANATGTGSLRKSCNLQDTLDTYYASLGSSTPNP